MSSTYSAYEAKAKFSEVLRKVRRGQRVRIAYQGKEIAELSPIVDPAPSVEDRLKELQEMGGIGPAANPKDLMKPVATRPGALARFLAERG